MVTKILFVCLGNICRSPAAEGVFKQKIKERDLEKLFVVDSAGTGGWHVGNLADPRMRETALSRGIELTSRSRKIKESDYMNMIISWLWIIIILTLLNH